MAKETIERYCRRVGRCLRCTRAHKQALIAGLREELLDRELSPGLSMEKLCAAVGKPKAVALQLEESLDTTEILTAQARVRRRTAVLCAALLLVLGIGAYLYFRYTSYLKSHTLAYYTERITILTGDETEDDGIIWGPVETASKQ